MAEEGLRPIIVKRIKKGGGGHHGGAWKIAYADFVTAMMAFFLLMWLLGSTTKGDLNGISEYFKTPLKVAMQGGSGSGDSSSVIPGGGKDLTRRDGQVKASDDPQIKKTFNLTAAKAALEAEENQRLKALKQKIEAQIEANPLLKKYKDQLLLDITSEGLRIQIVDEQNRPMFALAKAELQPYTREILHAIGFVLNDVPNKIGLSGHTDSTPYLSDAGYSNWELSADRANASRRELIAGGMADNKVLRVVGLASAAHLDKADPFNPINRRISIIVMNKRTEENVMRDGARQLDVDAEDGQAPAPAPAPSGPPVRK
ncbi:motility protein MotB [Duganella sp. BJB488]|uniref:flagellar motor protein MotB n=1 Tax=unclassified Duganella TaxID=2636909 RepID=UPI000E34DF13|nr:MULTISPECIES: flagellar motor protein MotB [unclassified Duganella]NVD72634.1 flagellar motor protein MotB [Duganella sp. BJB1802]RFP20245.1 motility protein MotB [Duganella sp. BJB489]RFP21307.1 motility protein MotB [Duganella sp. BJB488]RFP33449.1 motility protein MotB [Duganella sp. BJB480]